jgi:translation initiation factor eIF-2B subunit beta
MPGPEGDINDRINKFIEDLKYGNLNGSYSIALATIKLLQRIVSHTKWNNAKELMNNVKLHSKTFIEVQPAETVVHNMVCRVMKLIREDYARAQGSAEDVDPQSLHNMIARQSDDEDYTAHSPGLKGSIMESIGLMKQEIEDSRDNIAAQGIEHIHADEVIMTLGRSKTVEAFLKRAAKDRSFQVIVAECEPFYHGHELAKNLSEAGIHTTVITDSAIFAMMSRVNKVIIGTHSILANGGLKSVIGSHTLALAAKRHSVPLIVCTAMYKLSPQFQYAEDQDSFQKFLSPHDVLPFSEGSVVSKVLIHNPVFDYVPPELVTLFISNIGGNAPSYVYRLLRELYHPDDHVGLI